MFWSGLLTAGGFVRRVLGRALPPWRTVRRWSLRLLGVAVLCLSVGLPAVADLARAGTVAAAGYRTGYVAVGYASLALSVAVPVAYWLLAAALAAGTLAGRRVVALGRAVTLVAARRVARLLPDRRRDRPSNRRPGVR